MDTVECWFAAKKTSGGQPPAAGAGMGPSDRWYGCLERGMHKAPTGGKSWWISVVGGGAIFSLSVCYI